MTIAELQKLKNQHIPITMVTCYDSTFAMILNESEIDILLVGDSLAMVMHGHSSTIAATTNLMALHTAAVVRSAPKKFVVADFPFLAARRGVAKALDAAEKLMRAGANAVKIEGVDGHEDVIKYLVQSGIPVMGHIGLTPQSIHQLGGYRVQGREEAAAEALRVQAGKLQDLECFALVLECVPTSLAKEITKTLDIPTIGIGAGPFCDGQVLVLQDLLGLNPSFKAKFVRTFLDGATLVTKALSEYVREVRNGGYPNDKESYK